MTAQAGPKALPLNLLYWDFLARHRERLVHNPRMAQMVRTWERFAPDKQEQLRRDAGRFLDSLA